MPPAFYDLFGYNKTIFIIINKTLNKIQFLPTALKHLSSLFSIENFAIAYLVICLYSFFRLRKSATKERDFWPIYHELVRVGSCYAFFGLTYAALKFSVNLPRPFCSLNSSDFITIGNIASERCLSSFPSSHVGLSILISYFLWPIASKLSRLGLIIMVFLVSISRISLAMHFPSDIIYSMLVVTIIIIANNFIVSLLKEKVISPIGDQVKRIF